MRLDFTVRSPREIDFLYRAQDLSLSLFPPLRGEIYLTKVGALRNERSLTSRIKPRFIRIEILGQRESHPPLRKFV